MDVIGEKKIQGINQEGIEIRLSDIVAFIKANRLKILLGGVAGLIIGALYAFSKPNLFKVEVTVMPEFQGRGAAGLGAMSAFTSLGLDNSSAADAIRPDLYPNVLQSVPFGMNMLKQPVYSKILNEKVTLEQFINRTSTTSFLDKIFNLFTFKDNSVHTNEPNIHTTQAIQLTKEQDGLVKAVQGSVLATFDRKTGILTITAIEPDPVVAASVAELSLNYLTNYITAYRTDKARKRVLFLKRQTQEAKERYQAAEFALSNYRDKNRSLFLNTAKLDEQRLQADYILEQSVYSDLAKQLEQAKIKVQEDTPTFKTLEPPTVPLQKSSPKRTYIMLGSTIAGCILTVFLILVSQLMLRNQSI